MRNLSKLYISNAFSLSMLPDDCHVLRVTAAGDPADLASKFESAGCYDVVSCVGHADTARLFSSILGREIRPNRASVTLNTLDAVLVGQYRGPRLPEGATELPDGAEIAWYLVELF